MQLHKTDKARAELQSGKRTLGQRERSILILADGKKTVQSIELLFNGEAGQLARTLIENGYLEAVPQAPHSGQHPQDRTSDTASPAADPVPQATTPTQASITAPVQGALHAQTPPSVSADSLGGKRSLATTRMFLFDLSERMFASHEPAQVEAFQEALRVARDRDSMMEASRAMVAAIEEIAGRERADAISERIAMLLPSQD